jgi:hypothetical protein
MMHAQMTADEWIDAWANEPALNANPVTNEVELPNTIPRGGVVVFVNGGVYAATVQSVSTVLSDLFTPTGGKLRKALFELSGKDKETREFYKHASTLELAVILAWYREHA